MDANKNMQVDIPTTFVVFGASGNLMTTKIAPALYHLFAKGRLPKHFKVIGFARENLTDQTFSDRIFDALKAHADINITMCTDFCSLFTYVSGDFTNRADYAKLGKKLQEIDDSWKLCANKLFYLAVPPESLPTICNHLSHSGLTAPCGGPDGWSRVIVEKPFGENLETAKKLDMELKKLFKEEQIYRLDHYLGKEMIQNILIFRFANNLFAESWDNHSIEKIHIRLLEKVGIEERGSFYDKVGALEDVGQNHLLQMLALTTMDYPGTMDPAALRWKRAELLQTLVPFSADDIENCSYRSQYEGYRTIPKVDPKSQTETYFKLKLFLNHPKFAGVPMILESGKRMGQARKEIEITFKHPMPCLCPDKKNHYKNQILISWEPEEAIKIHFWAKKPGIASTLEKRSFDFLLHQKDDEHIEEYEKLIHDSIMGDQTLFVGTDEIAASWKFIDPIVAAWKQNAVPLHTYKIDSMEPSIASSYLEEEKLPSKHLLKKEIAIIGLGKMGSNLARRLLEKDWKVVGLDPLKRAVEHLEGVGLIGATSVENCISQLSGPRIIWLMVPAGKPVDEVLFGKHGLSAALQKGDIIIDGGNSFYKDSIRREKLLAKKGILFVDVGVSGGPEGALQGSSLMIGGTKDMFEKLEPLFFDLAAKDGYQFFAGIGAGHFVKMVHNGIEYGMMQAIAEGFSVLKKAKYKIDLESVAEVYDHGSVIESRLVDWLYKAFRLYGDDLKQISGTVGHTGEGEWTVKAAKEMKLKAKVIEDALAFRIDSEKHPSYAGKILSALREQFGGHAAKIGGKKRK